MGSIALESEKESLPGNCQLFLLFNELVNIYFRKGTIILCYLLLVKFWRHKSTLCAFLLQCTPSSFFSFSPNESQKVLHHGKSVESNNQEYSFNVQKNPHIWKATCYITVGILQHLLYQGKAVLATSKLSNCRDIEEKEGSRIFAPAFCTAGAKGFPVISTTA